MTQDEAGLFAVSAAFGFGFSGIIPAYVVVLRQLFPANEASWRIPTWFFCNICGMALGGWLAGVIYDRFGWYGPAFAAGVAFNIGNIAVVGWLAHGRDLQRCARSDVLGRETRSKNCPRLGTGEIASGSSSTDCAGIDITPATIWRAPTVSEIL